MVSRGNHQPFILILVIFLLGALPGCGGPPELAGHTIGSVSGEPFYEGIKECSSIPLSSEVDDCVLCPNFSKDSEKRCEDTGSEKCCECADWEVPFGGSLTLIMDVASFESRLELDPDRPAVWKDCENCDSCEELDVDKVLCYYGKTEKQVSVYINNSLEANPCVLTDPIAIHIYAEERPTFEAGFLSVKGQEFRIDPRVVLEPPIDP